MASEFWTDKYQEIEQALQSYCQAASAFIWSLWPAKRNKQFWVLNIPKQLIKNYVYLFQDLLLPIIQKYLL